MTIEAASKPWQRSEALAVGPDYDAMKARLSSIMSSAAYAGVEPPRRGPWNPATLEVLFVTTWPPSKPISRGRRRGGGLGWRRRGEEHTSDKSKDYSRVHFYTLRTISQTSRASLRLVSFQCEGASRRSPSQDTINE